MLSTKVFLDANVIIAAGKPPGGPLMHHISDLVEAGFIEVLTTDLTKIEVGKKHANNDYEVIKGLGRKHFRRIVADVIQVTLPAISAEELKARLMETYAKSTDKMFKALKAELLSIDDIPASLVFNDYAHEKGFFAGEGKKHQFPDAFIFECLKKQAKKETPVVVVSNDGDFDGPVKACKHISVVKGIPELFAALGLEVEEPDIEAFLESNLEDLQSLVNEELGQWGLEASDVEDAYIEDPTVTGLEVLNTRSFAHTAKDDDILVIGSMKINATVSYTHPDWDHAAWDSEDKVLIPFDDVSGKAEVEIEADFSLSIAVNAKGEPIEFKDFSFRNDRFIYVELHPDERYD